MRQRKLFAPHLAGWLFADLLIVLFLVALVSVPPTVAKPTPSASASSKPSPAPSKPPVLNLKSVDFWVRGVNVNLLLAGNDSAAQNLVQKFNEELRRNNVQNRRAGLILAFGTAPAHNYQDSLATRVAGKLVEVVSQRVEKFRFVASRLLWTPGDPGDIRVEVFFFDE
ncbi:hypothetical protein Rhe02_89490 [Rhizocola hellebori]|uniref:Uncharacterized protein n=1 Tax=Rhizocola hellebori TaxID=1392758 RepID=A0A8J3QJN7_9ACTN|nr:hypothetical protein [Rhizocola hellebori]GIH10882.1 hypothetical protein Rhe02_89490 [Rhizocola hellebori]